MRLLEALKILEDAVLDSLERPADRPEVREALDVLERYVSPEYPIRDFRKGLFLPNRRPFYLEGQQHDLNHSFGRIHRSVRELLARRIKELSGREIKTTDQKAELERLSAELERLPAKWAFMPRATRR